MNEKEAEKIFKAGWAAGYHDGGEHDCRMFAPTAQRAWEDYQRKQFFPCRCSKHQKNSIKNNDPNYRCLDCGGIVPTL